MLYGYYSWSQTNRLFGKICVEPNLMVSGRTCICRTWILWLQKLNIVVPLLVRAINLNFPFMIFFMHYQTSVILPIVCLNFKLVSSKLVFDCLRECYKLCQLPISWFYSKFALHFLPKKSALYSFSGYTYLPPSLFILVCSNYLFHWNHFNFAMRNPMLVYILEYWIFIWCYPDTENLVEQKKEFDAVIALEVCSYSHSTCGKLTWHYP